ncbi:MAG: zinc ribbon domain-containing protein [Eubacteriales bacterium]|nr:zinc ribbon domain-containing protein [Eubacteriales bacterium]
MFCKNCGAQIPEDSAFCAECGAHVIEEAVNPPQQAQSGQTAQPYTPPAQPYTPPAQAYAPPPAYGAAVMPKPKNTGLIVAVIILSVLAAAALAFVGLSYFSPKADPKEFDDVYEALLESSFIGSEAATAVTASADSQDSPALDLPGYEFVQSKYTDVEHTGYAYASEEDFMWDLTYITWMFDRAEGNPNATSFNGGYADIGDTDSLDGLPALYFDDEYLVTTMMLDPDDYSILYEDSIYHWVQPYNGTYVACMEIGNEAEYDGVMYEAVIIAFIDTYGELVTALTLYDVDTDTFIEISNYDVFTINYDTPGDDYPDHTSMAWSSQAEFESELTSWIWTYWYTDEQAVDMAVDDAYLYDITVDTMDKLIFYSDYTAYWVASDPYTLEILNEATSDYSVTWDTVYIYSGDYDYGGVNYECYYVYYIDYNGYLVERLALYDYSAGVTYYVSNANIYYPEGE